VFGLSAMLKPGWKFASFVVAVLAWRWFTKRASISETFRGKNVVICGGSTGIGEQIAYRFCEQGANVLVVARREWALRSVVENCSRLGAASASYIIADLQGGGIGNGHLLKVSKLTWRAFSRIEFFIEIDAHFSGPI
jgi:hypothetical protein